MDTCLYECQATGISGSSPLGHVLVPTQGSRWINICKHSRAEAEVTLKGNDILGLEQSSQPTAVIRID